MRINAVKTPSHTSQDKNALNKKDTLFFQPSIQPKLTINQPNDIYEQEADAMADKVIQQKETPAEKKFFSPPVVQRKCSHCEEEEKLQKKQINGNKIIQRQDKDEDPEQGSNLQIRKRFLPPLTSPSFLTPPDPIDYLGLHETFFNRGTLFPGSYMDAARQEWARQYLFYRQMAI